MEWMFGRLELLEASCCRCCGLTFQISTAGTGVGAYSRKLGRCYDSLPKTQNTMDQATIFPSSFSHALFKEVQSISRPIAELQVLTNPMLT